MVKARTVCVCIFLSFFLIMSGCKSAIDLNDLTILNPDSGLPGQTDINNLFTSGFVGMEFQYSSFIPGTPGGWVDVPEGTDGAVKYDTGNKIRIVYCEGEDSGAIQGDQIDTLWLVCAEGEDDAVSTGKILRTEKQVCEEGEGELSVYGDPINTGEYVSVAGSTTANKSWKEITTSGASVEVKHAGKKIGTVNLVKRSQNGISFFAGMPEITDPNYKDYILSISKIEVSYLSYTYEIKTINSDGSFNTYSNFWSLLGAWLFQNSMTIEISYKMEKPVTTIEETWYKLVDIYEYHRPIPVYEYYKVTNSNNYDKEIPIYGWHVYNEGIADVGNDFTEIPFKHGDIELGTLFLNDDGEGNLTVELEMKAEYAGLALAAYIGVFDDPEAIPDELDDTYLEDDFIGEFAYVKGSQVWVAAQVKF